MSVADVLILDPSQPYTVRPYSVLSGNLSIAEWVQSGSSGCYVALEEDTVRRYASINVDDAVYSCPPAFQCLTSSGLIVAPTDVDLAASWESLYDRVVAYLRRTIHLGDEGHYYAIASYISMTWGYQAFASLPYLRFFGDFGSGKTTALSAIASLAYRAVLTTGVITPASVFRLISKVNGTYLFDESDFNSTREEVQITKILNTGYTRGSSIVRMGADHQPHLFDVFGPKVIATREPFLDDALESRCLNIELAPWSLGLEPVSRPDLVKEAESIRNGFLALRLRNLFSPDVEAESFIAEYLESRRAEPRVIQLALPMIQCTPIAHRWMVMDFLSDSRLGYRRLRSNSIQGQILQAFLECGTPYCKLSDLRKRTGSFLNRNYSTYALGLIAEKMGFDRYHSREGVSIRLESNELLGKLRARYDV